MSFDLIVKDGTLPDGSFSDVAIKDGKIAAIDAAINAEVGEIIDASGCLISPPLVDPPFPYGCNPLLWHPSH